MTRNELSEMMKEFALPYQVKSIHSLFSMISSAGESCVVIVQVVVRDEYMYFVGYPTKDAAQSTADKIRRQRRVKVMDVIVINN